MKVTQLRLWWVLCGVSMRRGLPFREELWDTLFKGTICWLNGQGLSSAFLLLCPWPLGIRFSTRGSASVISLEEQSPVTRTKCSPDDDDIFASLLTLLRGQKKNCNLPFWYFFVFRHLPPDPHPKKVHLGSFGLGFEFHHDFYGCGILVRGCQNLN